MSIHNEPRHKAALLASIRALLEHRALWLYLLCDEAEKAGLPAEQFAPAAIKRCGLSQGAGLVKKGGTDTYAGLVRAAGFAVPFEAGAIAPVARQVADWVAAQGKLL